MPNNDILSAINDSIRQELNRVANEEIERLVHKFRCELGKHRTEIIGNLINRIEVLSLQEKDTSTIQINIRGGRDAE